VRERLQAVRDVLDHGLDSPKAYDRGIAMNEAIALLDALLATTEAPDCVEGR